MAIGSEVLEVLEPNGKQNYNFLAPVLHLAIAMRAHAQAAKAHVIHN